MLKSCLNRFRRTESGAVAIIFALSIVPIIGAAGIAMDYTRATGSRAKLNAFADGAALTALKVEQNQDPVQTARNFFNAQVTQLNDPNLTVQSLRITVDPQRTTARVRYSAEVKTLVASVFQPGIEIGGEAEATKGAPRDRELILVIDNSVSMQFPIDMSGRIPLGRDGCIFSCHVTLPEVRAQGVVSRLDAGITAYKTLTDRLSRDPGPIRYTVLASSRQLVNLIGPTGSKPQVHDALDRMSFDNSSHLGEHMGNVASLVTTLPGNRQRIVVLISDGLEEHRNTDYAPPPPQDPGGDPTWVGAPDGVGSRKNGLGFPSGTPGPSGFMAACSQIKSGGATIFAIYTPNYGHYPSFDPGHQENEPASRNALRNCASSGSFFVADSPRGLDTAISDIVGQISKLRISK